MTAVDRILQQHRIRVAVPWIGEEASVLDIGCGEDALLLRRIEQDIEEGYGLDPGITKSIQKKSPGLILRNGMFPQDAPKKKFNRIVLLATLEHMSSEIQKQFVRYCYTSCTAGGRIIITVPSPFVDTLLSILLKLKLIDGMKLNEHYGFDGRKTAELFPEPRFKLLIHKRFQLGLNNLFVFERR